MNFLKNTKTILLAFSLFAIISFIYSDAIVNWVSALPPIIVLFITSLFSPIYLLLLWALFKDYGVRGLIGGFIIGLASDTISLPHVLTVSGEKSMAIWHFIPETVFWEMIPNFLKFTINLPLVGAVNFAILLIYVILSISLIILALMIVHKKNFKDVFTRVV